MQRPHPPVAAGQVIERVNKTQQIRSVKADLVFSLGSQILSFRTIHSFFLTVGGPFARQDSWVAT